MRTSCINHPPNENFLFAQQWHMDCCENNVCAAMIIGYFQAVHIGGKPKISFTGVDDIEAGIMSAYKKQAIADSMRYLVCINLLTESRVSDEETADLCRLKQPAIFSAGHLCCKWCKSKTVILNKHHYPVRRRDKGVDTVSICASCHSEFHYLSETCFYTPSSKLLSLFESDLISLEDIL